MLFLLVNFFIYSCFLACIECIFIKQQCIPYNDIAAGKKKVFTYSKALITIFFKSTIYYTGYDGNLCLQEELCMEYQYSNLLMQLPNTKDY